MAFSTTPSAPAAITSCWIDPAGRFYAVDYVSHYDFANHMVPLTYPEVGSTGNPCWELETRHWLHISNSPDYMTPRLLSIVTDDRKFRKPTAAQVDALFDWGMAHKTAGNEHYVGLIMEWIQQHDS
jgi:hypothetical protein